MTKELLDQTTIKKTDPEKEMSFLDHLDELRGHIFKSIIAVVLVAIGVFVAKDFVFGTIIFGPKQPSFITYQFFCFVSDITCFYPPEFQLITRDMGEQFLVHIKVSIWLGLIVAFPFVFYQFWSFIRPGLYSHEQKAARGLVFVCSFLFLTGVLFGFVIVFPFAVNFLVNYQVGADAINSPTLASYVGYMTMITIPTGIVFELPILVYFLTKIGLLTSAFMKKYRRHAFLLVFVLAAIITPPDIFTQFLIGIPVYILYEISIIIAKRVEKNQKVASAA